MADAGLLQVFFARDSVVQSVFDPPMGFLCMSDRVSRLLRCLLVNYSSYSGSCQALAPLQRPQNQLGLTVCM